MEIIQSRQNRLVVDTAKLKDKKYRDETGLFIFDGIKLLSEALASGVELTNVFVTERMHDTVKTLIAAEGKLSPPRLVTVSEEVFDKLSAEKSPEGVISVAKHIDKLHILYKIYNSREFDLTKEALGNIFLVSSVRDPGNLGTILRSAAAFGVDTVLISRDCADLYHPRTLRASMGAAFRQRVYICEDMPSTVTALTAHYGVYAAALGKDAIDLDAMKESDRPTAFLVGNEGHGLSDEEINACTGTVLIPMAPNTESLNAAMAATVLMWEGWRRSRQ